MAELRGSRVLTPPKSAMLLGLIHPENRPCLQHVETGEKSDWLLDFEVVIVGGLVMLTFASAIRALITGEL